MRRAGIEGFNSYLAYYPADQLTIVALANVTGGAPGQIGRQLAAAVSTEKAQR